VAKELGVGKSIDAGKQAEKDTIVIDAVENKREKKESESLAAVSG